ENQTLRADSIYLSSSEGSSIGLTIESDRLGINSTTGGNIQLAGKANKQTASISLGGLYHAKLLTSQTANLTVTGGGRAEINASQSVDVQTPAGWVIDVHGYPRNAKKRQIADGRITDFKLSTYPSTKQYAWIDVIRSTTSISCILAHKKSWRKQYLCKGKYDRTRISQ